MRVRVACPWATARARSAGAQPAPRWTSMRTTEGTFETIDGLTLYEQAWLPEGTPRAVVVIVHGYAEHSGRYQHVGEALAARGYAVETLDLRGHGRSTGDRAIVRSF